jgi:hypothetical protein
MKIILKVMLVLVSAALPNALSAQQDILSTSCDAAGTGGTVSYSVGQVPYLAWTSATGAITEGVQQPYEIFTMAVNEKYTSDPGCIVFPNPTTGKVTLKFSNPALNNLSFCIYDMEGTQVSEDKIDSEEVSIPMDDLKPAIYFLVILEKNQPIKTFKIIKQ